MSNNNVKDWGEFQKMAELHQLEDLLFVGMLLIIITICLSKMSIMIHGSVKTKPAKYNEIIGIQSHSAISIIIDSGHYSS